MELVVRKHSRIDILDAVRGIAILSMVFYHALYDIADVFGYNISLFNVLGILEPPFAGAFILLAGMSSRFSHSNLKRGLRVLLLAAIITVATLLFSIYAKQDQTIYFGILHFMAVAILLYIPLRAPLEKIPPRAALLLWLLLFILTYHMPWDHAIGIPGLIEWQIPNRIVNAPGLFILGLPDPNFASADYFPIFPWFFLFLAGTVVGVPVAEHKLPEKFYTTRVPFFASAGRNTLLIYMLHQPVIYLLLTVVFQFAHVR